jgi:hypothetical protein
MAVGRRSTGQQHTLYEGALTAALARLTNQVFLFLIAYTILLIGIATFGAGLPAELRDLLYVIPVLGVAAYVWLQRRKAVRSASKPSVSVRSNEVSDQAYVAGVRGTDGEIGGNVTVRTRRASGSAAVIGIDAGARPEAVNSDLAYLKDLFERLEPHRRMDLVQRAQRHLKDQEQKHS